ncbi:hypothetical protein [Adhaeretor mobilis]|uniref:Uncharacterized protein n=1 Tax=Adhaeretor mobilis TaxID=1930276 RepID=A0A517MQP1_9BACT|nr:hypothetical protein [Adhaeretor mobilis]QDS97192.1 hypothetical protein HG15A2_04520 [Adhaeretor mobilis]
MILRKLSLVLVLIAVSFAVLYLAEGCSAGRALVLASFIGLIKAFTVAANDRKWASIEPSLKTRGLSVNE